MKLLYIEYVDLSNESTSYQQVPDLNTLSINMQISGMQTISSCRPHHSVLLNDDDVIHQVSSHQWVLDLNMQSPSMQIIFYNKFYWTQYT